jgi:hypothetical protein
MHTYHVFARSRIGPKQVHRHLLSLIIDAAQVDLEGTANFLNVLELCDR